MLNGTKNRQGMDKISFAQNQCSSEGNLIALEVLDLRKIAEKLCQLKSEKIDKN